MIEAIIDSYTTRDESEKLGKRERNRIANRHAIITAARDCFSEKGYDQVTVRDIIRRTGLASGTFYNYFPDKQAIFSALLEDYLERLSLNLDTLRKTKNSLEDYIYSTYLAIFQSIAEDPLIYKLAHTNDRVIRELYDTNILGNNKHTLEQDLELAIESGLLPNIDKELLSAAFFGFAYEIGLKVADDDQPNPKRAASFAKNLFIGGITCLSKGSTGEPLSAISA